MPQPAILPCSPARGLRRGQCRDLQAAVSGALRLQRLRVQRLAVQVLEHHGQRLAAVVYVELAEELKAFAGRGVGVARAFLENDFAAKGLVHLVGADRKSTRLNSSHLVISYAVFCLKKKKKTLIYHLT